MKAEDVPDISHLVRANLRAAVAENWRGTEAELDEAVDSVIAHAVEAVQRLRAEREASE